MKSRKGTVYRWVYACIVVGLLAATSRHIYGDAPCACKSSSACAQEIEDVSIVQVAELCDALGAEC